MTQEGDISACRRGWLFPMYLHRCSFASLFSLSHKTNLLKYKQNRNVGFEIFVLFCWLFEMGEKKKVSYSYPSFLGSTCTLDNSSCCPLLRTTFVVCKVNFCFTGNFRFAQTSLFWKFLELYSFAALRSEIRANLELIKDFQLRVTSQIKTQKQLSLFRIYECLCS